MCALAVLKHVVVSMLMLLLLLLLLLLVLLLLAVVNWHTPPEVRPQSLLRYCCGQVLEAQAGNGFPNKDQDYHKTLGGYKPHAPAPLDRYVSLSFFLSFSRGFSLTPMSLPCVCTRRMMACNLYNKGPYNTGAMPKGNSEGPMHPTYAIQ